MQAPAGLPKPWLHVRASALWGPGVSSRAVVGVLAQSSGPGQPDPMRRVFVMPLALTGVPGAIAGGSLTRPVATDPRGRPDVLPTLQAGPPNAIVEGPHVWLET